MRAAASLRVVRSGGRDVVVDRRSEAPFSLRRCGDRVLLASSAAAPVGGDTLSLAIDVGPGATASVGSVAATMVWPGPGGEPSCMLTTCEVASGAHLDLHMEPTVSVAGSRHRSATEIRLAPGATCRIVEEVVLGRREEVPGVLELVQRVERDGRPLVHHEELFGPEIPGAGSSVSVGDARVVLSAVFVGVVTAASRARVEAEGSGAWLPVADDAAVVFVAARERPAALDLFDSLLEQPTRSATLARS